MRRKTVYTPWWVLVAGLATIAVTACGNLQMAGVGSGGTGGGTVVAGSTYKASLSASTADGYLINAVVFLDKNSNYQLDRDETYAVTGIDGTAILEAGPAMLASSPVVAVAFKGVTVDSATMQPLLTTYVLSAPRAEAGTAGSALISPISTQVRELLETGRYSTVQQAMESLAGHLGVPSDINLLAENIASSTPALNAAAKSIAALMWMQNSQILAPGVTTPAVDVQRYRTMMKLIEDNMNIVSKLNTPENLLNLNSNIAVVLDAMPAAVTQQPVAAQPSAAKMSIEER